MLSALPTHPALGPKLTAQPITLEECKAFVAMHHRHTRPPVGWLAGVSAAADGVVVGVAVLSRPTGRMLDDGWTVEVTRVCTDGTKNACSFLYARARKAARELGYLRVVTYTLDSEAGVSLRSDGWSQVYLSKGHEWHHAGRPRTTAENPGDKWMWLAPGCVWETPEPRKRVRLPRNAAPLFGEAA